MKLNYNKYEKKHIRNCILDIIQFDFPTVLKVRIDWKNIELCAYQTVQIYNMPCGTSTFTSQHPRFRGDRIRVQFHYSFTFNGEIHRNEAERYLYQNEVFDEQYKRELRLKNILTK